jgi:threonine dehydratase
MSAASGIQAAAKVIDGPSSRRHAHSALSEITARGVSQVRGHQFTASFKERGALYKLMSRDAAQRKTGVIACSAGNHAQGVAYHAARRASPR